MKKKKKKWREIRLSRKRWKKELKRRRKRKLSCCSNEKRHHHEKNLRRNLAKNRKNTLSADGQFSIRNNPDETIRFLNSIRKSFFNDMPVYIDVSDIQSMTVDALLYLLALIDNMKYKNIPLQVQGNLPRNNEAREIFYQSGFLNYVDAQTDTISSSSTEDCVQIYDGQDVDPSIAKKLCSFAMNKFNKKRTDFKILYNIIMEIIINTKQHAYSGETNLPKWYVYARYSNDGIDFSILDTGYGIPSTVRKNFVDRLNQLIAKFPLVRTSESELIKSVMNGAFRTKTKEKYRGKGIPMITEQCNNEYINNLTLVSNKGFVITGENNRDLTTPLRGTLYYWRIEK